MKLYVAVLDTLTGGARLAQSGHAVAEIHAQQPAACAMWRETSNTIVCVEINATMLERLAFT